MRGRDTPALLVAVASAAGIGALVFTLRVPSAAPPVLPPLAAFSQSAPEVAAVEAPPEAQDPGLALERAAARGEDVARACAAAAAEAVCEVLVAHPDWGLLGARQVVDGMVVLGSTAAQVEAAWGPPAKKRAEGDRVVYCYDAACTSTLTLVGGRVVGLRE